MAQQVSEEKFSTYCKRLWLNFLRFRYSKRGDGVCLEMKAKWEGTVSHTLYISVMSSLLKFWGNCLSLQYVEAEPRAGADGLE